MCDPSFLWSLPPAELVLSGGEVHVWRVSLDQPTSYCQQLRETLSADEQTRAERFYFEQDRQRFIVGRGLLRAILGRYLNIKPSQIQFCYGTRGKPSLAATTAETLRFNLSHSQGLALYAVTPEREIGIDIEYIRPLSQVEKLAERIFSEGEKAVFYTLPSHQQQEAFFNGWTRKEAYVKAIGDGLAQPLEQIEVSFKPGEPAKLRSIAGDSQAASQWSLQQLIPEVGYVAALAVEGHSGRISCWHWTQ